MRPMTLFATACGFEAVGAVWNAWNSGDTARSAVAAALVGVALVWRAALRPPSRSDWRRIARGVAATAATLAMVAGAGMAWLWWGTTTMAWSVDGVANGGAAVVIAFPGDYYPCQGEPHVAVISESPDQIRIRVRLRNTHCTLKSARSYPAQTVTVQSPIAGRWISGPGLEAVPDAQSIFRGTLVTGHRMPDLVRLRIEQAKTALTAHDLQKVRFTGRGAIVTQQSPPPATLLPVPTVKIATD